MAQLFADFHEAHRIGSGHLLASCLVPVDTSPDSRRLRSFIQLSNHATISVDVRYHLFQSPGSSFKLPKQEANVWIDIFVALWTTVKELSAIEDSSPKANWNQVLKLTKNSQIHTFEVILMVFKAGQYQVSTRRANT